ncbi:MAG: hypothetical protein CVV05_01545 [Gammaproteobacteria bacterium HGW-Gammaproteobacteria-1]|jgi:nucleoside phosphorylase|nr:MAG: hypothetical protein CVV05_01545 [Gammaproteobacteria bacterium HGW-Gammaproteobacteria-1]
MKGALLPAFMLCAVVFGGIGYAVGREEAGAIIDMQQQNAAILDDMSVTMMEFYQVSIDRQRIVMAEVQQILSDEQKEQVRQRLSEVKKSNDWPAYSERVEQMLAAK